jgi:FSR family fosmidomycin resistance protein-like MFS transporter
MATLSAGHTCVDACQGAVPALLPFLIDRHDLTVAAATLLVLAATFGSAVLQPVLGAYSDRFSAPWLLAGGTAFACGGVALAGLAPSYPLLFAAILVSGFGVAAYHPEGTRFANYVSGARRATGMSYFSVGGNIGFALGPLIITGTVLLVGLEGTLVFALIGLAITAALQLELPRLLSFRPADAPGGPKHRPPSVRGSDDEPEPWLSFSLLVLALICRSIVYYTLLALMPLYFINEFDTSDATGNMALTILLFSGAIGTLIGGRLADRLGRRPVFAASMVLQVPLIVGLTLVGFGPAFVLAAVIGLVLLSTFGVTVVMGQELLPRRLGLAAGFTLGVGIGLGGMCAPLFGLIADTHGLAVAIQALAGVAALGVLFALAVKLPTESRRGLLIATEPSSPTI